MHFDILWHKEQFFVSFRFQHPPASVYFSGGTCQDGTTGTKPSYAPSREISLLRKHTGTRNKKLPRWLSLLWNTGMLLSEELWRNSESHSFAATFCKEVKDFHDSSMKVHKHGINTHEKKMTCLTVNTNPSYFQSSSNHLSQWFQGQIKWQRCKSGPVLMP